ncbi:hypothetical protein I0C86_37555 [Plantactinospora sp. S1510]|uniref:Uncharacterized protein n=1 Tax=Plantactinospora alkalitolerans TaxID=2789879 RepID=A0ABS0H8H4_9ACTN|nr:hypothetical protein [Plantactinospora alkalitolerans]MBF9134596.1 hypothetical protein [Plantactinospora alkalitolerans]
MSSLTYSRTLVAPLRRYLPSALLVAVGLVVGLALAWLSRDPHTATTERLTGTVIWSNEETRLIAFEVDGEVRDPLRGDTFYSVVGDWVDAAGTSHGSGAEYPTCLAGRPDEPVRTDRRRIEVEALHQGVGGEQKQHFAVSVRCLD